MWEIESDSVGNGRPELSLAPGQLGFVATPLRQVAGGNLTPRLSQNRT